MALDTVTLVESALDGERQAWLKESGPVVLLRRGSLVPLTELEATFPAGGAPGPRDQPDQATADGWRRRYRGAPRRLRRAGIETVADEEADAAAYVSLRARWHGHVAALAPFMAYRMENIDPAGSHAAASGGDGRHGTAQRLHVVD